MTSPATRHRRTRSILGLVLVLTGALTACAGDPGTARSGAGSASSATPSGGASPQKSGSPSPSGTTTTPPLPTDCRAILTESVLAELETTPLNDPAFAPHGVQPDATLVCVWRDPRADTTGLMTTISRMSRGPALDLLNELADQELFTCYTPDGGTRCEKTWPNPTYPVTDGRTLFWRDDVMIDTVFSHLAPSGYTDAIVASIF